MKRRVISFVLVLAMILSIVPMVVSAEGETSAPTATEYTFDPAYVTQESSGAFIADPNLWDQVPANNMLNELTAGDSSFLNANFKSARFLYNGSAIVHLFRVEVTTNVSYEYTVEDYQYQKADGTTVNTDPNFWNQDAIEIMYDTRGRKNLTAELATEGDPTTSTLYSQGGPRIFYLRINANGEYSSISDKTLTKTLDRTNQIRAPKVTKTVNDDGTATYVYELAFVDNDFNAQSYNDPDENGTYEGANKQYPKASLEIFATKTNGTEGSTPSSLHGLYWTSARANGLNPSQTQEGWGDLDSEGSYVTYKEVFTPATAVMNTFDKDYVTVPGHTPADELWDQVEWNNISNELGTNANNASARFKLGRYFADGIYTVYLFKVEVTSDIAPNFTLENDDDLYRDYFWYQDCVEIMFDDEGRTNLTSENMKASKYAFYRINANGVADLGKGAGSGTLGLGNLKTHTASTVEVDGKYVTTYDIAVVSDMWTNAKFEGENNEGANTVAPTFALEIHVCNTYGQAANGIPTGSCELYWSSDRVNFPINPSNSTQCYGLVDTEGSFITKVFTPATAVMNTFDKDYVTVPGHTPADSLWDQVEWYDISNTLGTNANNASARFKLGRYFADGIYTVYLFKVEVTSDIAPNFTLENDDDLYRDYFWYQDCVEIMFDDEGRTNLTSESMKAQKYAFYRINANGVADLGKGAGSGTLAIGNLKTHTASTVEVDGKYVTTYDIAVVSNMWTNAKFEGENNEGANTVAPTFALEIHICNTYGQAANGIPTGSCELYWSSDRVNFPINPSNSTQCYGLVDTEGSFITYVAMTGDVTNDGKVDVADAMMLFRYLAGVQAEGITLEVADMNGDAKVNIVDSLLLFRAVAGA